MPIELAGRLGTLNQLLIAVGLTLSFAVALVMEQFTTYDHYWRIVYFFPAIFVAVHVYNLLYTYPYETPKYLLEH